MRVKLIPWCLFLGLGGCQMPPLYSGDSSEHAAVVQPGDPAMRDPGTTPALRPPSETSIGASDITEPPLRFIEPGFGPPDIPPPAHPPEPPAGR